MSKASFYCRENFVYFFAAFASLLLSFWISYRETVINPDAVCYLLSAQSIGEVGIKGAMQLCGQAHWPFYSVLIYGFVRLTQLSYPISAYVLDGFFSLLSVLFFIQIVKELGGSLRIMWLSAIVILLSHEFNSVREYIIRDHGFWAFYLGSLLFLLRYFRSPSLKTGLAWSVSIMLATLFRIEGVIFLFALPLLSWFYLRFSFWQRAKCFITLNLPTLIIGLMMGSWVLLHPHESLDKLGRLADLPNQLQHGFLIINERIQTTKAGLAQHVLTTDSARDAGVVLLVLLISWYIVSVISNLSWAYGLLVIYAWLRKINPFTSAAMLVLMGYLIVNVAVTFGFLAEYFFLSKRYLIALSLVLMLWVPFALDNLLLQWSNLRHRIFLIFVAFFIFLTSLGGIIDFGYSKTYIHDAGNWLAANVPANASLYVNDYQLMYYSQHFGRSIFAKNVDNMYANVIAHGHWKQYDYLALRLSKREKGAMAEVLAEINRVPLQVFKNKRGDQVVIYKVSIQEKVS